MFAPAWSTTTTNSRNGSQSRISSVNAATTPRRTGTPTAPTPTAADDPTPPSSASSSVEHLPLHDPEAQPSPSILLNPLPVKPADSSRSPPSRTTALLSKLGVAGSSADDPPLSGSPDSVPRIVDSRGRRPSIVARIASIETEAPPQHFLDDNPEFEISSHPPHAQPESRSSSATGLRTAGNPFEGADVEDIGGAAFGRRTTSCSREARLRFAELPPGRRMYRSNSLSIGVASRARMLSNQGAGGGGARPNMQQARYAGPQQWYQQGGQTPEDIYTYKDLQKGLTKLWGKVRKRSGSSVSTTSSSSAAEASRMEADAKGKSKEIEHIEEADEDEPSQDEEAVASEEEEDDKTSAQALGLDLGPREGSIGSDSTFGTEDVPQTPEDGAHLHLAGLTVEPQPWTSAQKGKGVARRQTDAVVVV
ncbi:BZ3500_MvSof-1268-A1-R1_Chr4-3g07355 [Microbotryum saponariae]|uniref:BZ3500_MvSof-1268-A1-R1_Chr4-3g07355 protein n=1 Tax=Microbotryum saponariae TaxID=289078 RepID=A0A2X0LNY4_9BASI|nr:BZ3500_MvSof-1268-A1-R1_Chr4-3g07355 [Microbotryum saponariae]SDA07018.1 BZ3501_MvSof-1269-A2-R1_Chr4-2g07064 [Microbotryum saponariae]